MKTEAYREFWHILNDAQDLVESGYRQVHGETPSFTETALAPRDSIEGIAGEVALCQACKLHENRKNTVPGQGAAKPLVMVIGEGPGRNEDETGLPFVGKAGQYLDSWLEAIDLSREKNCFIANVVKCRPPNNRDPLPEEKEACIPYLERQIRILMPKMILTLGRIASQIILDSQEGIGVLRRRGGEYMGIPVIATYHPSAVLRNNDLRRPVWEDLKKLRGALDRLP